MLLQRFLELATAMRTASQNMMKAIAMSLKVKDVKVLANFHESIANQHLRFPYYPPQEPTAAGVPCGALCSLSLLVVYIRSKS